MKKKHEKVDTTEVGLMVCHLERIAVATEKTAAAIDETNTLLRRYLASESGEKRGKKVGQLSAHLMERGIRLIQKDPNRNVSQLKAPSQPSQP